MSEIVTEAAEALNAKMTGERMDGTVRFDITGEGAVIIDRVGARPASANEAADVTLSASAETFRAIVEGDMDPSAAFMTGKLSFTGDLSVAMQLGRVLGG